jgi:hypothetical protein
VGVTEILVLIRGSVFVEDRSLKFGGIGRCAMSWTRSGDAVVVFDSDEQRSPIGVSETHDCLVNFSVTEGTMLFSLELNGE